MKADLNAKGVGVKVGLHGLIGGISADISGGDFLSGFLTNAIPAFVSGKGLINNLADTGSAPLDILIRTLTVGLIGGAILELTGGEFETGFLMAAIAHLVNQEATREGQVAAYRQFLKDQRIMDLTSRVHGDEIGRGSGTYNGSSLSGGGIIMISPIGSLGSIVNPHASEFLVRFLIGGGENHVLSDTEMQWIESEINSGNITFDIDNPAANGDWYGGYFTTVQFGSFGEDSYNAIRTANLFYNGSDELVGFTDYYDFPFEGFTSFPNYVPGSEPYWNIWGEFSCQHPSCSTLNLQ